jgi:hypothetical protein
VKFSEIVKRVAEHNGYSVSHVRKLLRPGDHRAERNAEIHRLYYDEGRSLGDIVEVTSLSERQVRRIVNEREAA